jgi:GNAT superfamily N-acetyltransferase
MAGLTDAEELTTMSMELYNEVVSRKSLLENKIVATLRFYEVNRNMGQVLMIEADGKLVGYAIVFRYWSDEYGGLMLGIDELFVRRSHRRLGVAKGFIHGFIANERNNPLLVGIELEAHASNDVANRLFASVGFPKNENSFYIKLIKR